MNPETKNPAANVKNIALFGGFVLVVVLLLAGACTLSWCWKNRDTNETRRSARKAASVAVRDAKPEAVLPTLERLLNEKSRHIWFEPKDEKEQSKWKFWNLRWGDLPSVTVDYVAQLTEDQFLRFAGDGKSIPANVGVLKSLLDFSGKLIQNPELSKSAQASLTERRLDGFFLANDFAGAIALLEKGALPNRTPTWQKATAAKLRSHKAMEEKNWKEACTQMLVFIEFMLSEEQKDFEDCDPTTGIVYSREWVVARNYLRCANFMKDVKDDAKSQEYRGLADKYFKAAVEKAKDDADALKSLEEEMKANGFTFVAPVKEEKKPAEAAKPEAKPAEAAKPAAETKPADAQKPDAAK